MRQSVTFTVSLPPAMSRQVERAMKAEHRTRSELVREALRTYLSARPSPREQPTRAEAPAYREGMADYKRAANVTPQPRDTGSGRPRRGRTAELAECFASSARKSTTLPRLPTPPSARERTYQDHAWR